MEPLEIRRVKRRTKKEKKEYFLKIRLIHDKREREREREKKKNPTTKHSHTHTRRQRNRNRK